MRTIEVYSNDVHMGRLEELPGGGYRFRYSDKYFADNTTHGLSVTMPKTRQEYTSDHIFPFFTNMLPEGGNRRVLCRQAKVDDNDFFGMLMASRGCDFAGCINLR